MHLCGQVTVTSPFSFLEGLVFTATMASIVTNAEYFEMLMMRYTGYCPHCRYRLDHPIVRHDDVIGECGWRLPDHSVFPQDCIPLD